MYSLAGCETSRVCKYNSQSTCHWSNTTSCWAYLCPSCCHVLAHFAIDNSKCQNMLLKWLDYNINLKTCLFLSISSIAFYLDRDNFPDLLETKTIFPYQFLHGCKIWLCSRFFSSKYGNICHLGTTA